MNARPNLADAGLAVGVVIYETAKLPLHVAQRLPGMRRLAQEGALVRLRLRSALEGRIDDLLHAPEVERVVERLAAELAVTAPDAAADAPQPTITVFDRGS